MYNLSKLCKPWITLPKNSENRILKARILRGTHHNMSYSPTRWPESPRIVMRCACMGVKWPYSPRRLFDLDPSVGPGEQEKHDEDHELLEAVLDSMERTCEIPEFEEA